MNRKLFRIILVVFFVVLMYFYSNNKNTSDYSAENLKDVPVEGIGYLCEIAVADYMNGYAFVRLSDEPHPEDIYEQVLSSDRIYAINMEEINPNYQVDQDVLAAQKIIVYLKSDKFGYLDIDAKISGNGIVETSPPVLDIFKVEFVEIRIKKRNPSLASRWCTPDSFFDLSYFDQSIIHCVDHYFKCINKSLVIESSHKNGSALGHDANEHFYGYFLNEMILLFYIM